MKSDLKKYFLLSNQGFPGFFRNLIKIRWQEKKLLPPYFSSSSKGVPFLREGI
jgi:hypothetical protein